MNEAEDINEGGSMADDWPSVIHGAGGGIEFFGGIIPEWDI